MAIPEVSETSTLWQKVKQCSGSSVYTSGERFSYLYRLIMLPGPSGRMLQSEEEKMADENDDSDQRAEREVAKADAVYPFLCAETKRMCEPIFTLLDTTSQDDKCHPRHFVEGCVNELLIQDLALNYKKFEARRCYLHFDLSEVQQILEQCVNWEKAAVDFSACVWVPEFSHCLHWKSYPYFKKYPERLPFPLQPRGNDSPNSKEEHQPGKRQRVD